MYICSFEFLSSLISYDISNYIYFNIWSLASCDAIFLFAERAPLFYSVVFWCLSCDTFYDFFYSMILFSHIDSNFHLLILALSTFFIALFFYPVNASASYTGTDLPGASTIFNIISEGIPVLDALRIITRSMHNCRVLGFYGGIQKLTALMKGVLHIS